VQSLKEVAQETLSVIERGAYVTPSGRERVIAEEIAAAIEETIVYRPADDLPLPEARVSAPLRTEVWADGTSSAGRELVQKQGVAHVVALNFASAKNPGGGFLSGAKAQEEDLARCSALYACLKDAHAYYDANRISGSALYTDHIVYSPDVPFFRDEELRFLEEPFLLSIITAPAPNAGAWGCGVFRNDPDEVADAFARALDEPALKGAFERVVFAIRDGGGANMSAFQRKFGGR
jgi:uncharacterized protein (TIGR02452 family)